MSHPLQLKRRCQGTVGAKLWPKYQHYEGFVFEDVQIVDRSIVGNELGECLRGVDVP